MQEHDCTYCDNKLYTFEPSEITPSNESNLLGKESLKCDPQGKPICRECINAFKMWKIFVLTNSDLATYLEEKLTEWRSQKLQSLEE